MSQHLAFGPAGESLLGFLCSVGTLVTLTRAWPERDPRISWTRHAGWRPVFHIHGDSTEDEVVETLHTALSGRESAPELTRLGDNLSVDPEKFRKFAEDAAGAAKPDDRRWADFAAAFGCEATADDEKIQDTALRTMSGAGHEHFLAVMRNLSERTNAEHLRTALFADWSYEDDGKKMTMRWDPNDDRRYALRADDPSGAHRFTVWGANRLAIEALPCFPTAPRGGVLETTAFIPSRQGRNRTWAIRWPVWTAPLRLPALQSLLTHPKLLAEQPDAGALVSLGVAAIFQSRRVTVGRMRNFTPAHAWFVASASEATSISESRGDSRHLR